MSTKAKNYLKKILGDLTFSEMIYSLRKTDELTQQEVAEGINLPKSRVCDFEKGRRLPTLDQAAKLADFFGYPRSFFYKRIFEDQARNSGINLKIEVKEKIAL